MLTGGKCTSWAFAMNSTRTITNFTKPLERWYGHLCVRTIFQHYIISHSRRYHVVGVLLRKIASNIFRKRMTPKCFVTEILSYGSVGSILIVSRAFSQKITHSVRQWSDYVSVYLQNEFHSVRSGVVFKKLSLFGTVCRLIDVLACIMLNVSRGLLHFLHFIAKIPPSFVYMILFHFQCSITSTETIIMWSILKIKVVEEVEITLWDLKASETDVSQYSDSVFLCFIFCHVEIRV